MQTSALQENTEEAAWAVPKPHAASAVQEGHAPGGIPLMDLPAEVSLVSSIAQSALQGILPGPSPQLETIVSENLQLWEGGVCISCHVARQTQVQGLFNKLYKLHHC